VKEAADVLGVSEVTVRRHVAAGKLPSKRLGRAVRVDLGRLG
jgi:excisionase family DNA binding protein